MGIYAKADQIASRMVRVQPWLYLEVVKTAQAAGVEMDAPRDKYDVSMGLGSGPHRRGKDSGKSTEEGDGQP